MPSGATSRFDLDARLLDAVQEQNIGALEKCLADGASPNAIRETEDSFCRTIEPALYIAAKAQNAALVKLLLEHGADPSLEYRQNCVIGFETSTCLIAAFPSLDIVRMLLEAGANPNGASSSGEDRKTDTSALKSASLNYRSPELEALLKSFGAEY